MRKNKGVRPEEGKMYDLTLVMPVYNEVGCIETVMQSWYETLRIAEIDFRMIIVDDGSTDGTSNVLDGFSQTDRIDVLHQTNAGHGPTILHGYREAVKSTQWVFQCDSDNEMSPESFPALWAMRHEADAVFGYRVNRKQSLARKIISWGARATIRIFFGNGIKDVNTPYRLLRATALKPILDQISSEAFAPNVIISGVLAFSGARLKHLAVPHQPRRTGSVSIVKWKLWRGAFQSFCETLQFRRKAVSLQGQTPCNVESTKESQESPQTSVKEITYTRRAYTKDHSCS